MSKLVQYLSLLLKVAFEAAGMNWCDDHKRHLGICTGCSFPIPLKKRPVKGLYINCYKCHTRVTKSLDQNILPLTTTMIVWSQDRRTEGEEKGRDSWRLLQDNYFCIYLFFAPSSKTEKYINSHRNSISISSHEFLSSGERIHLEFDAPSIASASATGFLWTENILDSSFFLLLWWFNTSLLTSTISHHHSHVITKTWRLSLQCFHFFKPSLS